MRIPRSLLRAESFILTLVFLSILWKGGKALDAVWALSLVSVASVFVAFVFRSRSTVALQRIPLHFFVLTLLFIILTCVSFSFSTTQNYGLDEVFQTIALGLIFLLTIALADSVTFRIRFAKVLSLALLFALVIGCAVYIYQPVSRFVGSFFDYRFHTDYWPNAWGEFFLLAWPMLLWTLFLRRRLSLRDRILSSCVLGIAFGGFFLSYSRGSFIAFAGQIALVCVLSIYHYRRAFAWRSVLLLGLLSLLVALVTFTGFNHLRSAHFPVESVVEKATFRSSEGSSSIDERQLFFQQSLELIRLRPMFGYGPYAFRFIQPHVQEDVLQTSDHPHNVFLKLALERGVPTSIVFFIILLFSLLPSFVTFVRRSHSPLDFLSLSFFISVIGVFAHNLIDYNLQFVGIGLPVWLMMGFLASPQVSKSSAQLQSFYRILLLCIAAVFSIVVAIEAGFLTLSSFARHAEARGDRALALQYYSYTDHSFFSRDAWLSRAAILLTEHNYQAAENAVSTYILHNAADARGWRLLGDIYLAWDKRADAIRAYEKAFDYGKWNDAGIIRGLVYLLQSDTQKLTASRHDIDSLLNAYAFSIRHNEHFIALGFNVEEVVSLAKLLASSFPVDRQAYLTLADEVTEHALLERSTYSSRPRGFLW